MEFEDNESAVFDDIMDMLQKYPNFHKYQLRDESILSLPGLEIYLERRKIYSESEEINLTTKEFDMLEEYDSSILSKLIDRVYLYGDGNLQVVFKNDDYFRTVCVEGIG